MIQVKSEEPVWISRDLEEAEVQLRVADMIIEDLLGDTARLLMS